jgi:hypothetical protein
MSRMRNRKHETSTLASGTQAARRTAARVRPLARNTGAVTARRVHQTRAWAAPQVERAGRVVQDRVAPRISALLSSAARRLEPARPQRRRWPKLVGGSAFTAAVAAVAALVRSRMKRDSASSAADADADDVKPVAKQTPNGQAKTSTDTNTKQPTRTS